MMIRWVLLLLLLPSPALASDRESAAGGGGAVATAAIAGLLARRRARHKKAQRVVDSEGDRFGWSEERRSRELHGVKNKRHAHRSKRGRRPLL